MFNGLLALDDLQITPGSCPEPGKFENHFIYIVKLPFTFREATRLRVGLNCMSQVRAINSRTYLIHFLHMLQNEEGNQ